LSYLANTQTNKNWQKHYLLGGGNKHVSVLFTRRRVVDRIVNDGIYAVRDDAVSNSRSNYFNKNYCRLFH